MKKFFKFSLSAIVLMTCVGLPGASAQATAAEQTLAFGSDGATQTGAVYRSINPFYLASASSYNDKTPAELSASPAAAYTSKPITVELKWRDLQSGITELQWQRTDSSSLPLLESAWNILDEQKLSKGLLTFDPITTKGKYWLHVKVTNGVNKTTVRSFGPYTKLTSATEDSTPPTKPKIMISNKNWTKSAVAVRIIPGTDRESQVTTKYRQVDKDGNTLIDWKIYTGAINISREGETKVEVSSENVAGGKTDASAWVRIDTKAPVSNAEQLAATAEGYIPVKITISDNNGSGLFKREAVLERTAQTPLSGYRTYEEDTFNIEIKEKGKWFIHVRTRDAAGNVNKEVHGPFTKN